MPVGRVWGEGWRWEEHCRSSTQQWPVLEPHPHSVIYRHEREFQTTQSLSHHQYSKSLGYYDYIRLR